MSNQNLLEVALKNRFRFPYKGQLPTEDLYVLNVEELDKIYQSLSAQKKAAEGESLLHTKSKEAEEIDVKIEIVKSIVAMRLEEAEEAKKAQEKRKRKQEILALIADKENEELKGKSKEDLLKMLEEL